MRCTIGHDPSIVVVVSWCEEMAWEVAPVPTTIIPSGPLSRPVFRLRCRLQLMRRVMGHVLMVGRGVVGCEEVAKKLVPSFYNSLDSIQSRTFPFDHIWHRKSCDA